MIDPTDDPSALGRRTFFRAIAAAGALPIPFDVADGPAGRTLVPPAEISPELRRGPYLQAQGPTRIVVRWRTDESPAADQVRLLYGDRPEALDRSVPARIADTPFEDGRDWIATVEGLEPGRTYYYAIEVARAVLAGGDPAHTFRTAPAPGSAGPVRFLALGDAGTNRVLTGNPGKALAARNGFRRYRERQGLGPVDGILLLGDNAYSHGTDSQYQTALFSLYRDELRGTPLWPCLGNHELTDDYFSIFTVPERGESGGVPSGCLNYYAFDFANVHVVVLDLWRAHWHEPDAPQRRWLEADLAATRQDWVVVINHFPPYCAGKYESDTNGFLVEVRTRILPVLEAHGVDLLLTGHDHTYQRSYLLDGHHGPRASFDPARHVKAEGDGTVEPLVKRHGPHSGLIAVVSGTAGAEQPADPSNPPGQRLDHPAMVPLARGDQAGRGARRLGSFLLEVDGLMLTGTQVDDEGEVVDRFRLRKVR